MPKKTKKGQTRFIRNSERQSFKRCRQQWYWNFIERIKPDEDAIPLKFGDLVHQSLAAYYKRGIRRGPHPAKTFARLYDEHCKVEGPFNMKQGQSSDDPDPANWLDAGELGEAMLNGYVDKYGEHDKQFKILSSEQTFQVPLRAKSPTLGVVKFVIVGTLDGIWVHRDGTQDPFFKEFKTTGDAIKNVVVGLALDEQAGTYWTYAPKWLWKHGFLEEGVYPNHILYTFLRKAMPDERPTDELGRCLNKDGTISKKQPSARLDRWPIYRDAPDRKRMHQRVLDEALEMEAVRAGKLAVIKNPGPLYNPNCRGCPFRDPCELHEAGADYQAMLDNAYISWDPYAAHEMIERW